MISRVPKDVREVLAGACILFVIVTLAFAPFAYGDRSLMSSAEEVPALFPTGGGTSFPPKIIFKGLDPGAAGWQTEPELFLEHDQVTNEHVFPLWNPYVGFGQPLAADMLSQPFYPLTWLVLADRSARAYNWFIILRFYAAAFFAFLFLRLFVRFAAALAGAIGFAFTGYLVLYFNIAHLSVECLIPALVWAMELLARRRSPAAVVRLAIVLAVVVFGGMPESALLAFVFAYAYFVVRIITDPKQRTTWIDATLKLLGSSALGLGMSACLLLPFAEFVKLSVNQHEARLIGLDMGLINDGFSFEYFGPYLVPLIFGPPWANIFSGFSGWSTIRGWFGVTQVCFAFIAVVSVGLEFRVRRTKPWSPEPYLIAAAVFLLLKRFGSPIVNWTGALPGLDLIEFPKYDEAILGFCVACLAAFGIERMAAGKIRPVEAWIAVVVPLATLTALAGIEKARFLTLTAHQSFYLAGLGFAVFMLCVTSGLLWASSSNRWTAFSTRFAAAAFALIVVESFGSYFIPMWYILNDPAPLSRSSTNGAEYVTFLKEQAASDHSRFFGEDAILYPEWSSAYGISDVRDLNALYDFRYLAFARAFLPAGPGTELTDRFTGLKQLQFHDPAELRFLQLSSIGYIGATHQLGGDPSLLSQALASRPADVGPALRQGTFLIGGSRRDAVFMHAPRVEYPVPARVPADARTLLFSIGMDASVWSNPATLCGDGVTFAVDVRDARGKVTRLAHEYIDPKHNVAERKWFDLSAPVRRWAGQAVDLLFSTLPGPSGKNCADWALWSGVGFDTARGAGAGSPFSIAFRSPDLTIYRYSGALPRLAVYTNVVGASSDDDALRHLTSRAFNPFRQAVVTQSASESHGLPLSLPSSEGEVAAGHISRYSSQIVTGTVETRLPALVVLNDTDYPGWVASVDGSDAKIVTANYMFRGIVVPPGRHSVEFRYRPQSFRVGLSITVASIILGMMYLAAGRWLDVRKKRRAGESE